MSYAPWLLMLGFVTLLVIYFSLKSPGNTGTRVSYSLLRQQVDTGNVKSVKVYGEILSGNWNKIPPNPPADGDKLTEEFNLVLPPNISAEPNFWDDLRKKGHEVDAEPREPSYAQQTIFWLVGSATLIFFLHLYDAAEFDPLGGGMMGNFIRSQAKRFQPSEQRTTFQDVAALEQAKLELQEIVEFLKNPREIRAARGADSQRRAADGPAGNGQDAARAGRRRRGGRPLLLD